MRAMVLAAGLGTRMRPLTETTPKPLIEVAGKKLIDWSLDALVEAGISEIVVNVSYLAEQVEAHVATRKDADYILSHEAEPLETGGGIKKALTHLGDAPFIVTNSDAFYLNGQAAIAELMAHETHAPITLVLQEKTRSVGYHGAGDFFCDAQGSIARKGSHATAPYVFTGIQKLHPEIFHTSPSEPKFSMNVLYNQHIDAQDMLGGVEGLVHAGTWLHVGSVEEKEQAEAYLANPV